MRARDLSIAILIATASIAAADPWKTAIDVALRVRPGARQRVVAKLPAGTPIVIERQQGTWIRIRAGKRVGYVARTAIVDAGVVAQDDPLQPSKPLAPFTRKTTIEVVLRAKPGEKQAVVAKLPAGTAVVIDAEDGRWYHVRAGKLAGYLARTTVEEPPAPPPVAVAPEPPRERWGAERVVATKTGGSGLFVGVTAPTATLYGEARMTAAPVGTLSRGTRLAVIETTSGWLHVRTDDHREAWVSRADVDNGTAAVAFASPDRVAVTGSTDRASPARRPGRTRARAGVALGYRSLGMDFTSNGTAGLSNYLISAEAAAADVELDASTQLSRFRIGADARLQLGTSSPGAGIEYTGPSRAGGTIAFDTFASDAGVRIGLRRRIFELALRGGFHYDTFLTRDLANAGRLPREHLLGGTAGARVAIVPPSSRVDVELRFDMLALGLRDQTSGLEDGAASTAGAIWGGATIRFAIGRHLSVSSAFDFARATTEWTGMSVRDPSATSARRVDSMQTVRIGLAAQL